MSQRAGGAADAVGLTFPAVTSARGVSEITGRFNFLLGNDPSRWATGLAAFERVDLVDGMGDVDVEVSVLGGDVSIRLRAPASTSLAGLVLPFHGVRDVSACADGTVRVETAAGQRAAMSVTTPAGRNDLSLRTHRLPDGSFVVAVDGIDSDQPGPIEAVLSMHWATLLGGSELELVRGVGFAPGGEVVVIGQTTSMDFPITPGALDDVLAPVLPPGTSSEGDEIFVTRLSANGEDLAYSTFLGGEEGEWAYAPLVAPDGSVYIAGRTNSPGFPTPPGGVSIPGSGPAIPVFVTKLSPSGDEVLFTAMLGASGSGANVPKDMILDDENRIIVVGQSGQAADFPVTPDAMKSTKEGTDAFIFRLSADGSVLEYSSYFGGNDLRAVALTPTGDVVVAGRAPGQVPPPGAFSTVENSIFVARLAPELNVIKASTYFGGISGDVVHDMAIGPDERIYIAGETLSDDLPVTPGAFETTSACALCGDGFVTCFDPMLSSLVYSTYVAGGLLVKAYALRVDGAGVATVVGTSNGAGLPATPGAMDTTWNGKTDLYALRLSPDGTTAWYLTYFGGTDHDGFGLPAHMDIDDTGSIVLGSTTLSSDFPVTPEAPQSRLQGPVDAVVVRLDMLPAGVIKYGTSTPGCLGPLAIGVVSMPQVGSETFALTCSNAPPGSSMGLAAVSLGALDIPVAAAGTQAWVDPSQLVALVPVQSDAFGLAIVPVRLPTSPAAAGLGALVQFFWKDPCGPAGWTASNALDITIQP